MLYHLSACVVGLVDEDARFGTIGKIHFVEPTDDVPTTVFRREDYWCCPACLPCRRLYVVKAVETTPHHQYSLPISELVGDAVYNAHLPTLGLCLMRIC